MSKTILLLMLILIMSVGLFLFVDFRNDNPVIVDRLIQIVYPPDWTTKAEQRQIEGEAAKPHRILLARTQISSALT